MSCGCSITAPTIMHCITRLNPYSISSSITWWCWCWWRLEYPSTFSTDRLFVIQGVAGRPFSFWKIDGSSSRGHLPLRSPLFTIKHKSIHSEFFFSVNQPNDKTLKVSKENLNLSLSLYLAANWCVCKVYLADDKYLCTVYVP